MIKIYPDLNFFIDNTLSKEFQIVIIRSYNCRYNFVLLTHEFGINTLIKLLTVLLEY